MPVFMALPAVKGALIVGGVAVALGVALYEHEPFREWVHEQWRNTESAFEDFLNDIHPERRRRFQFGESAGPAPGSERPRPWRFGRRRSDGEGAGATTGRAEDGNAAGMMRRRRGSNNGAEGMPLDDMSRRAMSVEAILDNAGPESANQSVDLGSEFDSQSLQHLLPQEHNSDAGAYTPATYDALSRRGSGSAFDDDANMSMLTPSTSSGDYDEFGNGRAMSEASGEIVRTPLSTRPGSVADDEEDEELESGDDARSVSTETMSHVSQDPVVGGASGEVRSMESSWDSLDGEAEARRTVDA